MESKEEIVISGVSGRFPECYNIQQYKEALLEGKCLFTQDERRFPAAYKGVPKQTGKIPELDKFDATFFGIHPRQASILDPRHRILFETTFEAIIDAGYNPEELRGSNTGVFIGMAMTFTTKLPEDANEYYHIINAPYHAANRMSYFFDFKGPSISMDTACSASLYAFTVAYQKLIAGEIDAAIVAGANINLNPREALEFAQLGVLSPDGNTKTFNKDRLGFTKSEVVCSYFLQRKSDSRRVYATVVGAQANIDGYKTEGFSHPSHTMQAALMKNVYAKAKISIDDVVYLEMHGTGTMVGDLVETEAVVDVYRNRKEPLLAGSGKSNTGHAESGAGVVGLAKLIIAMETGIIPATINVEPIDPQISSLSKGILKIVTRNTELKNGLLGVSSFGVCGANAHVLLKPTAERKPQQSIVKTHRLVQVSGRTEESVDVWLDEIEKNSNDEGFLLLTDEINKRQIAGFDYRGYTTLGQQPVREISKCKPGKRPIWFIFSGMGSQWPGMGKELMNIETFKNTINRCAVALKPHGVDLKSIIYNETPSAYENIVNVFSTITAITIALVDLLTSLDIIPDFMAGHSLGEVGCAYADGGITPEQAVLLGYARGYALSKVTLPKGRMAAIGLAKEALEKIIPKDIYIVCTNSKDSITISGLEAPVTEFVEKLTKEGVFARLVDSGNVAFHSPYLNGADNHLYDFIKKVLPNPVRRTEKWISTSVLAKNSHEIWTQYNGAEYHVNNYRNPVYFNDIFEKIQKNAIVIEISPHSLLQAILKRELGPENTLIGLLRKTIPDQEQCLLSSIGKIFNAGGQPNLKNLYKNGQFPVSRGTKMISPLLKWDHSDTWNVQLWKKKDYFGKTISISLSDEKYAYFSGHTIDGRILLPATGYLVLVWTVLAEKHMKDIKDVPVVFENTKFIRAVVLSETKKVELVINIMKKSGNFEILEGGSIAVTGKIREVEDVSKEFSPNIKIEEDLTQPLPGSYLEIEDVYKELNLRRLAYEGPFKAITEMNFDGTSAKLIWNNSFTGFIDAMLQLGIFDVKERHLLLPNGIKKVIIDPKTFLSNVQNNRVKVVRNSNCNITQCKGIEIFSLSLAIVAKRQKIQTTPMLEYFKYVPYISPSNEQYDLDTSLIIATQIILQNIRGLTKKIAITEIQQDKEDACDEILAKIENIYKTKILTRVERLKISPQNLDNNLNVLVASEKMLEVALEASKTNHYMNFVLCIGNFTDKQFKDFNTIFQSPYISLLRLKQEHSKFSKAILIKNSNFSWLEQVKEAADKTKDVLLYSQHQPTSGIMGLTTCLRTENTKATFSMAFINQHAPEFTMDNEFYRNHLSKKLAFNVLMDNTWGTYICLPLESIKPKRSANSILGIKTFGDLSTLCWFETPELSKSSNPDEIVDVNYLALNFKDVMFSTGKLHSNKTSDVMIGFEFSGTTPTNKRLMGMVSDSLTLKLLTEPYFTWEVPESWSMEQAATIPVAYITVYYALVVRGHMEQNESILIHAGCGAVGLAAISVALSLNATVFTTVSTEVKKQFLLKRFSQLDATNIGNSRDASFYSLIKKKTEGKGVDLVLNSLAGELFQMSIGCLGREGRFLEIGKVDMVNGSHIDTQIFLKNCSFHGIMVEELYDNIKIRKQIHKLISEGIASGVVQPLPTTIYEAEQVEQAFRYLSTGKHIGKVIVQIQKETPSPQTSIQTVPKIHFSPDKVYIIVGGLGGMGLELAHWLYLKGARKVVLNARRKIWNGYQAFCMNTWKHLNYLAIVDLNNSIMMDGAEKLIENAEQYGPVGGIFNTALVLKDSPISEQTVKLFEDVLQPKIASSENLDVITRKRCPELDHFVMFSSVVTGSGIIGQTNYGMANSALERLCEVRRRDGLSGLAVEWGPIADVGILMSDRFTNRKYAGVEYQKIESCWQSLETLMIQNVTVGSSLVCTSEQSNSKKEKTPIDVIAYVLGIENVDKIDKGKTLFNFGVDSLMTAEIKQIIYQEFQQEIDFEEIRTLTFEALFNMNNNRK